jgi:hypothetical protein
LDNPIKEKIRMRKNVIISLIAGAMLVLSTSAASALSVNAVINYGNSAVANGIAGTPTEAVADLTAGDVIGVSITIDNPTADLVGAAFATLTWDGNLVSYLGGGFTGPVLVGTCTGFLCAAPSLGAGIAAPQLKPLSPFNQSTGDTDWLQVVAHTSTSGTNGEGPDVVANLGFTVLPGGAGLTQINFDMILEPNSDTIAGPGGAAFAGPISLGNAVVNVPEPGTALLMGLGLLGLGVAGRRES